MRCCYLSIIYSITNYITVEVNNLSSIIFIFSIIVARSSSAAQSKVLLLLFTSLDKVIHYLINDGRLMALPRIFSHVTRSCLSDKCTTVPVSPLTQRKIRCLHCQVSLFIKDDHHAEVLRRLVSFKRVHSRGVILMGADVCTVGAPVCCSLGRCGLCESRSLVCASFLGITFPRPNWYLLRFQPGSNIASSSFSLPGYSYVVLVNLSSHG